MIRKAVIVALLLGAGFTTQFWVSTSSVLRASSFQADVVSFGVPGLSNVFLTDDEWLPRVNSVFGATKVTLPFWMVVAALLVYPTIAFIRGPLRRWRRRKRGECLNCGYNLTGNVTGVCSECGTAVR